MSRGQRLLEVVLPSVAVDKRFSRRGGAYDCNQYILHRDRLGAMIIDPAKGMRGNFGACRADFKLGFLRLLNHSSTPNVKIVSGETATPDWYEGVGEPYHLWYECSVVAKRKIRAGEELTIKYGVAPKGAKRPASGTKKKRRHGSKSVSRRVR